jgi:predicted nucleotidyltransferase
MNNSNIVKSNRQEIIRIAAAHGASNIRLFGSFARDESGPGSDIDLLVDMEPQRSLLDIIAIKHKIEDITNCKVDVVTAAALSPYIRDQVLHEAVAL